MSADTEAPVKKMPTWLQPVYDKLFPNQGKLQEESHHASWLAYLLTSVMGGAAILIFGNQDFPYLFSHDPAQMAFAGLRIGVIFFGVFIADRCFVRSYERLGALKWRGETFLYYEHWAYMLFVLAINGTTIFLVFSSSIPALISGKNLIPHNWLTFIEIIKAVLLAWTTFQILSTSDKLLVEWGTVLRQAAELLGGKAKEWLKTLDVDIADPSSLFAAYNATVKGLQKPQREKRYWFNAEKRKAADQAYAAQMATLEDTKRNELITALQQFGASKDRTIADERTQMQTDLAKAQQDANDKIGEALLLFFTTGTLPQWVLDAHPALANASIKGFKPTRVGSGNGSNKNNASIGNDLPSVLERAGISLVRKATKKDDKSGKVETRTGVRLRGGWVTSTDIVRLSDGKVSTQEAKNQALLLGEGYKVGLAYACPVRPVIADLAQRNRLIAPVLEWFNAQQATENGESTEEDNAA